MLKTLPLLLAFALAAPALAQDGGAPPAVSPGAPEQAQPETGSEATPALPAPEPAPADAPVASAPATDEAAAPPPAEAAVPLVHAPVETDLVSIVKVAHPVVQAVMALLAASIFAVLTIFLFKAVEFQMAFASLRRNARALAGADGVPALPGDTPLALTARAAHDELAALPPVLTADLRSSARERLDLSLARIEAGAVQRLRSGTGLLASIGAVAPFVGLFGTVFGIMNSFLAIAETKTTNLAVVAPGIAEALLATGIGLVAAIPAVLLYNRTMRRIAAFRHGLADGTAEVLRRFSRALDARMGG